MRLVLPSPEQLPGYVDALERGWAFEFGDGDAGRLDALARIRDDAAAFLAAQVDREAKGPPISLPDGSTVPRLPGYKLWMWDGEFCGSISFRWQPGTEALPPTCLGHIGYGVVPWKRRRGYATAALRMLLPHARREGLGYVELTTDAGNDSSRRVIETNGGVLVERFTKLENHGGGEALRFRIDLAGPECAALGRRSRPGS